MTKKDFLLKLKELKLTINDFAEIVKLPVSTLYGWHRDGKDAPAWVEAFIYYYEKAMKYEKIINDKLLEIDKK